MTSDRIAPQSPDVTSEACAWIAQLETNDLTPEDLEAFREWIGRSPRHAAEITRLAHLSNDINVLAEMAGPLQDAANSIDPVVTAPGDRPAFPWRGLAAAAIGLMAFAVMTVVFLSLPSDEPPLYPFVVATEIGAREEVALKDGTIVTLNTDTQLEVDFERSQRNVRLLKGEAYFNVAHDPDRPFSVYVRDKYVRAVGTAFAIRMLDEEITVTVSDGKVEIAEIPAGPRKRLDETAKRPQPAATKNGAPSGKLALIAGQSLAFSDLRSPNPARNISDRELARQLSWKQGFLDFSDTQLADVVAEMSRYTKLKIEISDPELSALAFGGIFRAGEVQALFDALETTFDIEVDYVNDDLVLLRRKPGD